MKPNLRIVMSLAAAGLIGLQHGGEVSAQQPLTPKPVYDSAAGTFISVEELIERLTGADVVYVGETHTNYAHHLAQLDILKGLHASNPRLVMGWEMFHSSQQPLLDAYTGGWLPEVEWLDAIYWKQTWGHPYSYYRPLLDYARDNGVRVFGLNAPRAVVRGVRTLGREGMTEDLAYWLPAGFWDRIHIDTEKPYEEWFMENARHSEDMTDDMMKLMFCSQTAWNEIMAWNIVKAFNVIPDPGVQVLIIVGSGHAIFGQGIPTRVALLRSDFKQVVVMPYTSDRVMPLDEILEEEMGLEGDYIWFVPPAGDPPDLERPGPPEDPPPSHRP